MFNKLLKGLSGKPALPDLEVVGYEHETLSFKCLKPLPMGLCEANARLPDGRVLNAHLLIESFLEDQGIYWAQLVNKELHEVLEEVYPPPPPEELEEAAEPIIEWTEKRAHERLQRVLGMMCPIVTGFKCLSFDLTAEGVRLCSDNELPVGKQTRFRLELDDARIPPMEMKGTVVWSAPRPGTKGFWAGLLFDDLSPQHKTTIEKYLQKMREVEHGVFTREYADD